MFKYKEKMAFTYLQSSEYVTQCRHKMLLSAYRWAITSLRS